MSGIAIEYGRELVKVNGEIYEVGKPVAAYMQYQEDTIKQLRAALEKQDRDWQKGVELLKMRNAELVPHSPATNPAAINSGR